MTDRCPNCNARRDDIANFVCRHEFHSTVPYKPDLMFSFKRPGPQHSITVSETQLKRSIAEARNYGGFATIADAAERMIEMTRAPKPKLKLDPTTSIRRQLALLLQDVGLNPDGFLTNPADVRYIKETGMCDPDKVSKPEAERAAGELALMLQHDLSINVTPVILRLWLIERWEKVAKLAHKIHGSA